MALTPFWLEDFIEWTAADEVGVWSGTGWSDLGVGLQARVAADANFFSGKCVEQFNGMTDASIYTFIPTAAVAIVYSFNMIRTLDNSAPVSPGLSGGEGLRFETGVADNWLRFVPDTSALGVGNRYLLQVRSGAVGTFATLFTTANIYQRGVKIPVGLAFDPAAGTISLYMPDATGHLVLVYQANYAPFVGLGFTGVRVGRMGTDAPSATQRYGDWFCYTGSGYVGQVEIRSGFPNANGPTQGWTVIGGGSAFDAINNLFTAAAVNYLLASVAQVSEFAAPVSAANVAMIWGASHQYYAIRTGVTGVDMRGRTGEAVTWAFANGALNQPPQAAYQRFADIYGQTNPRTAAAWTQADMANMALSYQRT